MYICYITVIIYIYIVITRRRRRRKLRRDNYYQFILYYYGIEYENTIELYIKCNDKERVQKE